MDFTHLNALENRLFNEGRYLAAAKSDGERKLRTVWIEQINKEIERERKFIGVEAQSKPDQEISDEELLSELGL